MIKGLHYVSGMGTSGYFAAARRLILALAEAGVDVTWTPVVNIFHKKKIEIFPDAATGDAALDRFCHRNLDCDSMLLHTPPELMPHFLDQKQGKRVIGYTVWETEILPPHWIPILNRLDHLLVPSAWNREIFRNQGVRVPISVLPHLPGPACPAPHSRWASIPERDLVFYCIETWSVRKNLEQTITLFRQCFTENDGVRLVVKTSLWLETGMLDRWPALRPLKSFSFLMHLLRRMLPKKIFRLLRENVHARLRRIEARTPGGAPVDLITKKLAWDEIEGLHQRGNCYFSLTHSEGFGLGPFDAAAAGKPVIITGWGGMLDYLDPAHGCLVDSDPVPAWDRSERGYWAQPRLSHAASILKAFHADPESARHRGMEARDILHDRFGAAAIIPLLKVILFQD
jgi:glycosyltransferase involved in cell wall biosynthesis